MRHTSLIPRGWVVAGCVVIGWVVEGSGGDSSTVFASNCRRYTVRSFPCGGIVDGGSPRHNATCALL